MKKTITAIVITSLLVGCGEDKTPEQIKFEQEKELLLIQQRHEREMKKLDVQKVAAENGEYTENTEYNGGYNNAIREEQVESTTTPTAQTTDSGFSGGEMLLAGAAGMAAGYALSSNKEVIKEKANTVIDKSKEKVQKIKESPKTKSIKEKAKYQARKAKVLTKKAAKKAKRKVKK